MSSLVVSTQTMRTCSFWCQNATLYNIKDLTCLIQTAKIQNFQHFKMQNYKTKNEGWTHQLTYGQERLHTIRSNWTLADVGYTDYIRQWLIGWEASICFMNQMSLGNAFLKSLVFFKEETKTRAELLDQEKIFVRRWLLLTRADE